MKTELTASRLRELLHFDPETGVFTRLIGVQGPNGAAGAVCGSKDSDGYICIRLKGQRYAAHRLAWFYVHGEWPANQIDHINGQRTDNRLVNLRDVTPQINSQNRRAAQTGKQIPFLGVAAWKKKFKALIEVDKKTCYLGLFATPEEAHQAYLKAKRALHEGCTI